MRKFLLILTILFCTPILCGFFDSKPKKVKEVRVLEITETGDIVIGVNDKMAKPEMKFDIFRINNKPDLDDPNKIISVEIPVARIVITYTSPSYSIGTIVSRIDGNKPKISDISVGMLCRKTTKQTLKAEKEVYKNQQKALKRQYKLMKIKAKKGVYESLEKTVQDANKTDSIKAGLIKVEKHSEDGNNAK